jgi:hypothetical protein
MRVANMPALFASAEASSIESGCLLNKRSREQNKETLTSRNDDSLSYGNFPQDRPHISFHLGIDSGAKLVDEQIRRISCKPKNIQNRLTKMG